MTALATAPLPLGACSFAPVAGGPINWLPSIQEYRQKLQFGRKVIEAGVLDYWKKEGLSVLIQRTGAPQRAITELVPDLIDGCVDWRFVVALAKAEQVLLSCRGEVAAADAEQADCGIRVLDQPRLQQVAGDGVKLVGAICGWFGAALPCESREIGLPDLDLHGAGREFGFPEPCRGSFGQAQQFALHVFAAGEINVGGQGPRGPSGAGRRTPVAARYVPTGCWV